MLFCPGLYRSLWHFVSSLWCSVFIAQGNKSIWHHHHPYNSNYHITVIQLLDHNHTSISATTNTITVTQLNTSSYQHCRGTPGLWGSVRCRGCVWWRRCGRCRGRPRTPPSSHPGGSGRRGRPVSAPLYSLPKPAKHSGQGIRKGGVRDGRWSIYIFNQPQNCLTLRRWKCCFPHVYSQPHEFAHTH